MTIKTKIKLWCWRLTDEDKADLCGFFRALLGIPAFWCVYYGGIQ